MLLAASNRIVTNSSLFQEDIYCLLNQKSSGKQPQVLNNQRHDPQVKPFLSFCYTTLRFITSWSQDVSCSSRHSHNKIQNTIGGKRAPPKLFIQLSIRKKSLPHMAPCNLDGQKLCHTYFSLDQSMVSGNWFRLGTLLTEQDPGFCQQRKARWGKELFERKLGMSATTRYGAD